MTDQLPDFPSEPRPELLLICGVLGLVGTLAPVLAMLIAWPIAEHDLIADTVSDLGRGPHRIIMDTGFYANSAALLALAIASAHLHLGRARWSFGIFCLSLLALLTTMIGLWDAFGRTDEDAKGMSVHTWLTFGLGPLYFAGPILMATGVKRVFPRLVPLFYASAVLWIVFAFAFKLASDGYDGILEKVAVAATLLWTVPLAWLLFSFGRSSGN